MTYTIETRNGHHVVTLYSEDEYEQAVAYIQNAWNIVAEVFERFREEHGMAVDEFIEYMEDWE